MSFLLLICCKSIALQTISDSNFNDVLKRAEQLNDRDPTAALVLLSEYQAQLSTQQITNQVNFYRIQSTAYSDQALYSLSNAAAEQGLKLAKQMSNPSIYIAELAYTKGYSLENLGNFDGAFQLYQNGLDVARSMNNQELTARGLINIGAILYLRKDYKQSLIILNQALKIANELTDDALLGDINSELGILYSYIGDEVQANNYFEQSYQYFKKAGKHNYALNSLQNVAINHANQKRYDEALKVNRILESEIQPNTSNQFIASIYRNLAWALLNKDEADIENAYRYIILAGEYVKEVEQHFVKLQYVIDKAYILEKMKRYHEALSNLEQAEVMLEGKDSDIYDTSELNLLILQAKLHYALGHYRKAYELQSQYFIKSEAYEQVRETTEIDELKVQYESEAAQRQKNILETKQRIQDLQLQKMSIDADSRQVFVGVLAVFILLLAWLLFRIVKGQRKLIHATRTDILTGVINRRRLLQLGDEFFLTAKVEQQSFSVFMIDIDLFKQVNDKFGHNVGDKVLKEIALQCHHSMREADAIGRFGGEEFIALLPNTNNNEAVELAQRLRRKIENTQWQTEQVKQLTISIGIATFEQNNFGSFSALLNAADRHLLNAKKTGRNKVSYDD